MRPAFQTAFLLLTLSYIPGIATNDSKLPRILDELVVPNRIEYSNGDKIKLRCPVSGENPFKITWNKDGVFIDDSLARHFSITGKWGQFFRISRMSDEDSGDYECKGTNGYGSASYTFSVRKKGKPKGAQLLSSSMISGAVQIGDPSELKCLLKDFGENDVIRWLKRLEKDPPESSPILRDVIRIPASSLSKDKKRSSFKRLDPEKDDRISFTNVSYSFEGSKIDSFSLVIQQSELSDSGYYVCLLVEPLVDKKFKFNIGKLVVEDDSVGRSNAQILLAWNKVTLWAIFIPISFILLVIPIICIIPCLQPNSNIDDSSKKEMASGVVEAPRHPFTISNGGFQPESQEDDSSHFYQPLSLRYGPVGESTLGLTHGQARGKDL